MKHFLPSAVLLRRFLVPGMVHLLVLAAACPLWGQLPGEAPPVQSGPLLEPLRPNAPKDRKWRILEGPRVEVFYYGEYEDLAERTLRYGETAWRELTAELEFIPNTKLQLQVFPNAMAWQRADWDPLQVRDRNIINTTAAVYYPGSQRAFFRQIKAQAAHLLVQEVLFSGASLVSLQNRVVLHLPGWYDRGMANYLGYGWTPEDEALLRSIDPGQWLEILQNEEVSPRAQALQKSLWHFVDVRFGRKKISEILYMTRITRSVNGGFLSVLGLSRQALTAAWREFARQAYLDQRIVLLNRGGVRRLSLGGRKREPVAMAASESGRLLGVVLYERGKYSLYLYDTKYAELNFTGVRTQAPRARNLVDAPEAALAWSPNEAYLAAAMPNGQGQLLVYYNPKRREADVVDPQQELDWINSIHWSPNQKDIVLSANRDGNTDLYLTAKGRNRFIPLTRDPYDDLAPVFSQNEEDVIYFTSNRGDSLLTRYRPSKMDLNAYSNPRDLYVLENYREQAERRIARLTRKPLQDDYILWANRQGYLFRTTARGLTNVAYHDVPSRTNTPLTDYATGVLGFESSERYGFVRSYYKGQAAVYRRDTLNLNKQETGKKTLEQKRREAAWAARDTAQPEPPTEPSRLLPTDEPTDDPFRDQPEAEPADTSTEDTTQERLRFYVFDESEQKKAVGKRKKPEERRSFTNTQVEEDIVQVDSFDINTLRPEPPLYAGARGRLTKVEVNVGIDPIYRYNLGLRLVLEDPYRYHKVEAGFRGFWGFQSSDTWIDYLYRRHKLHVQGRFELSNRLLDIVQDFRYTAYKLHLSAHYPLGRHHRLSFTSGLVQLRRLDLFLFDQLDFDDQALLLPLQLRYQADNTLQRGIYPLSGWRASLALGAHFNLQGEGLGYTNLKADIRRYFRLPGDVVLAGRLSGGFSLGGGDQTFVLGGMPNWFNLQFPNRNELPVTGPVEDIYFTQFILPMRGFGYNARNGAHYALANAELRFPILKLFSTYLNPKELYNTQFILFYDMGMSWTNGNPFSQRNPVDLEVLDGETAVVMRVQSLKRPILQGFGAAVQTVLLGLDLRLDVAWGLEDGSIGAPLGAVTVGTGF